MAIATLFIERSPAISMTVSDQVAIPKGTLLQLIDNFQVSGNDLQGQPAAGIAKNEKVFLDGKNTMAVYTNGVWRVTLSGSCNVGEMLSLGVAGNDVYVGAKGDLDNKGHRIGRALETGADNDTIFMELHPINVS